MEQTMEAQRERQCLEEIAYNVMGQFREQIAGDDSGGGAMQAAQELARRFLTVRPDTFAPNPSADALDKLWQDVILAHKPDYGDWEYPGMAYRHLLAEFNELRAEREEVARLSHQYRNERDRLAAALRVLAEFAGTAPGRLPQRVQDALAVADRALHPQQEPSDG